MNNELLSAARVLHRQHTLTVPHSVIRFFATGTYLHAASDVENLSNNTVCSAVHDACSATRSDRVARNVVFPEPLAYRSH